MVFDFVLSRLHGELESDGASLGRSYGRVLPSCPAAQLRCRQGPNGPNEKDPRPSDGEKAKICEDTQTVTNIGLSIDFQYLLANILSYIYSNHYSFTYFATCNSYKQRQTVIYGNDRHLRSIEIGNIW